MRITMKRKTHNKIKKRRNTLRTHKYRKSIKRTTRRYKRGGNENDKNKKVTCCMCEKDVYKNDTLVPMTCLLKHGKKAHRICNKCWWDKEKGFGLETSIHKCPGCIKNLPLTKVEPDNEAIDLTMDDE